MSAVANRDYRLQTCILAGVVIDPHGEWASPVLDIDPVGEVFQGSETDVYSRMTNVGGSLVFSMRQEESAYSQLLNLFNASKVPGSTLQLSGSLVNASTGRRAVWTNAMFTELPNFELGTQSNIVTFTLRVSNVQYL